jgi:integrase/recombinase XerD
MGRASWIDGDGPLVPFARGYRQELMRLGHPPSTVKPYMVQLGQLNRWLSDEGLSVSGLTSVVAEAFLATRRARGRRRASLAPFLEYLRRQDVLAPAPTPPPTVRDGVLTRYHRHLVHDRGLRPTTVLRYERFARRFLAQRASWIGVEVGTEGLTSTAVNSYMLEASSRLVVESAKREAADLRALLRFLYLEGSLATDLGSAMPPVATWRGTRLPPTMSTAEVDSLLTSCDRTTKSGRRDYAVLTLLARLGLRSGEVAAVRLSDVNWRAGEILVRGKAGRLDHLPLAVEVGEALVDYLRYDRPPCELPQLILTLYAPPRPIHPSSIASLVYRACRRAGVAQVGGHRLRHAFATEMLRQGADLLEIAQVLRQSDPGTTSGYAKVDRGALRTVAQPWPGATR